MTAREMAEILLKEGDREIEIGLEMGHVRAVDNKTAEVGMNVFVTLGVCFLHGSHASERELAKWPMLVSVDTAAITRIPLTVNGVEAVRIHGDPQ